MLEYHGIRSINLKKRSFRVPYSALVLFSSTASTGSGVTFDFYVRLSHKEGFFWHDMYDIHQRIWEGLADKFYHFSG